MENLILSNVVQLFKDEEPTAVKDAGDIRNLVGNITDWAESHGVDTSDRDFLVRCTDVVTLLQIMVNECKQVKHA